MKKIRAVVYGAGATGLDIARELVRRGVEIVAAIDIEHVGEDLGELAGLNRRLNVAIRDDADETLQETRADVAIVSVASGLEEMHPHIKRCLEAGINVTTTSEETLYPWNASPELAADLDRTAEMHGVSFMGAGYQDIFEVNLPVMLTGASKELTGVHGVNRYNIDDYGPAVARYFLAGEKKSEAEQKLSKGEGPQSFFRMTLEAQIAALGLSEKEYSQETRPVVADQSVQSEAIGRTIEEGELLGLEIDVRIQTYEGIEFTGTEIAKVYDQEDGDLNAWTIKGVPEMHVEDKPTPVKVGTATQIVNRLPDLINHKPGYVSVTELPLPRYRVGPLQLYVNG